MNSLKRRLIAAAGIAFVSLAIGLTDTRYAGGQGGPPTQNVLVTNPTTNPVPTAAQGMTTIAGNVGITGTPTVNLGVGNSVGINGSVQIGNAETSPVPVSDVDNPALQPFNATTTVSWRDGDFLNGFGIATVPLGKRLVIEYVNFKINMLPNQKPYRTVLYAGFFPDVRAYYLPAIFQARSFGGGFDQWVVSQPVRIYASANEALSAQVYRDSNSGGLDTAIEVNVSGYLIDVP